MIPICPEDPNSGIWPEWQGWAKFLNIDKLSFVEARRIVRGMGLHSKREWELACRRKEIPERIPTNPNRAYRKEWIGWNDFLGTSNVATHDAKDGYRSLESATQFVSSLGLKNRKEWKQYCISGNKPKDIPTDPSRGYENWIGWGKFLGTNNVLYRSYPGRKDNELNPYWLLFEEARSIIHQQHLKNYKQWKEFCRSGKKPKRIPATPETVYKSFGWCGWKDFLGH